MGKGDIKSKKGKRVRGSFGKSRPRKTFAKVDVNAPSEKKTAAKKKTAKEKPEAKKTAAKKPATKKAPAKKAAAKK